MNKCLTIIFLLISLIANAQKMKKVDPIDISSMLSYEEFQEIKQFVLDKGQTRTYCNRYNDNPYYELKDYVELYLNPVAQFPQKEDVKKPATYNTILIRIRDREDYPFMYTYFVEDASAKKIYLEPYWDTKESMKIREKKIGKYIANILKEIRQ